MTALADGRTELIAPNGTRIEIVDAKPPLELPPTQHSFVVRKLEDSDSWGVGRAGMRYRDLIPGRLGGRIIASHIRIPGGGPVPDMVHFHSIGFQLIFCYRGWVKVVYEDQGPPFVLGAGDCVLQPPEWEAIFASAPSAPSASSESRGFLRTVVRSAGPSFASAGRGTVRKDAPLEPLPCTVFAELADGADGRDGSNIPFSGM